MMREERSKELASLDAEKMTAIQRMTGSQPTRNARRFDTGA